MKNAAYQTKPSKGIRISQIALGAIAIILSLAILIYPGIGIASLIFLLSITLLVVGIERVAAGFLPHLTKSSRIGNIVLGGLTIGLGIVVLAFSSTCNNLFSYFASCWAALCRICKNHSWCRK